MGKIIEKDKSQSFSLPVEGMTCASCVARVEKAIGKVEGVKNVSVNIATEKASFEIDPLRVDIKKIAEVVDDAGYKLKLPVTESSTGVKEDINESSENSESENTFYTALTKDLFFALILTIPVFIISMSMEFSWFYKLFPSNIDHSKLMENINKILLIITTPIVFISGKRFFVIFWNNLKHFAADMNSLVAIGTGTSYIYSLLATLFPDLVISSGKAPHVYFDSTAVIITLILMGRWLENRAKRKTGAAIKKLLELKPKTAEV
ncbi:MAG: copper ion binding protein, partial [Bacteroidota bacterium]|nr:copper ion binding protein [Bacteroidota bacterium]